MNELFEKILNKIYASKFYEQLAHFQNKTVSKWQSYLLRNPIYWKWASFKYSNTVHWGLLFGLAIGLFVGIMLPISAPRQPGRSHEFEFAPPSSVNSRIIITPNLVNTKVENSAEIEITLLDEDLNPIKNRSISLIASGENISLSQREGVTSLNGKFYAQISSNTAGVKELMVRDNDSTYTLEKKAYIEFTNNEVTTWRKPGSIGDEGATAVAIPEEGDYKQWQVSTTLTKASIENLFEKEELRNDSCALFENEFYCSGGLNTENQPQTEFYKGSNDSGINNLAPIPAPVYNHQIIENNDYLILAGGRIDDDVSRSAFQYNPETDDWKQIESMHNPKENFVLAKLNNSIYALGGYNGSNQINNVEKYENEKWTEVQGMSTHRNFHSGTVWNNRIYVFGGWNGENVLGTGEVYDAEQNKWFMIANLPTPRWAHNSVLYKDKIYLLGGYDSSNVPIEQIDVFNTKSNSWTTIESKIKIGNYSIASTTNEILLIGGSENPTQIVQFIPEEYPVVISQNNNVRRGGRPSTQIEFVNASAVGEWVSREIPSLDLSQTDQLKIQLYSTQDNPNLSFGFGETSSAENIFDLSIEQKELWKEIVIDISNVAAEDKNSVRFLGFKLNVLEETVRINIYDIWTENTFYSECPCKNEISNIFFAKDESKMWRKFVISSLNGSTSEIEAFIRSGENVTELPNMEWTLVAPPYSLSEIGDNSIELKFVLIDQETKDLPELRSVSVEVE